MTGEQRVLGALQRKAIDRVPTFEWLISERVREALVPGSTYDEFIEAMDIDAAVVELNLKKTWINDVTYRDGWGTVKQITAEEYAVPLSGPMSGIEDLKSYIPPDYTDASHYKRLEEALEYHKDKRAVILRLNDVFSIPSRLVKSFEDFMVATMVDQDFIIELIDITIETYLGFAREAVKRGCKIVFTGDDYAFNTNPMVSPRVFEELFYPELKRVMRGYKESGLLVIKHSDGNIMPLIDMIMDTDINCIDPIDPLGGMDLGFMKKTYGDRFCIKGNVECAGSLSVGTTEEVIAETKKCLDTAMAGGGYICSSSNSILSSVKPENYKAMLDTIKEYGVYSV